MSALNNFIKAAKTLVRPLVAVLGMGALVAVANDVQAQTTPKPKPPSNVPLGQTFQEKIGPKVTIKKDGTKETFKHSEVILQGTAPIPGNVGAPAPGTPAVVKTRIVGIKQTPGAKDPTMSWSQKYKKQHHNHSFMQDHPELYIRKTDTLKAGTTPAPVVSIPGKNNVFINKVVDTLIIEHPAPPAPKPIIIEHKKVHDAWRLEIGRYQDATAEKAMGTDQGWAVNIESRTFGPRTGNDSTGHGIFQAVAGAHLADPKKVEITSMDCGECVIKGNVDARNINSSVYAGMKVGPTIDVGKSPLSFSVQGVGMVVERFPLKYDVTKKGSYTSGDYLTLTPEKRATYNRTSFVYGGEVNVYLDFAKKFETKKSPSNGRGFFLNAKADLLKSTEQQSFSNPYNPQFGLHEQPKSLGGFRPSLTLSAGFRF